MSSAGHIFDMIRKMEQNRAIQKAIGGRFRNSNPGYKPPTKSSGESNPNLKTYTPEERILLRNKIFDEAKKDNLKKNIYTFIVLLLIILVIYILL